MHLAPPPDLELTLPAHPQSVGAARHAVRGFAERIGVPPRAVDDLMLAVSEACANVVVHAYDRPEEGSFRLTVSVTDGRVSVSVRDWGRGMVPRSDSPGLGLGLPLMSRISESLEIRGREGEGAEVRMTVPVAPVHNGGGSPGLRPAA